MTNQFQILHSHFRKDGIMESNLVLFIFNYFNYFIAPDNRFDYFHFIEIIWNVCPPDIFLHFDNSDWIRKKNVLSRARYWPGWVFWAVLCGHFLSSMSPGNVASLVASVELLRRRRLSLFFRFGNHRQRVATLWGNSQSRSDNHYGNEKWSVKSSS